MWLLIDDLRDLGCEVIARTPEAARKLLTFSGYLFDCVCFDHDLGTEETGLDILRYGINSDTLPNHIQIVTSNPVGRETMGKELRSAGYFTKDGGTNWIKECVD